MKNWAPAMIILGLTPIFGCDDEQVPESCEAEIALGTVATIDRPSDYIVAAPHGTFDLFTADIVDQLCSTLPWDCIVAREYVADGTRINVNRPSEGAGLPSNAEARTHRARCVFDYFRTSASDIWAPNGPKLYVEVHGGGVTSIEVATVGLDRAAATRVKSLLQAAWNRSGGSPVTVAVEPVDTIIMTASANKAFGMLNRVPAALHFEFPRALRENERMAVIDFLDHGLASVAASEFP